MFVQNKVTPLHTATQNGQAQVVKMLVNSEASLNAVDKVKMQKIMFRDIVSMLVDCTI